MDNNILNLNLMLRIFFWRLAANLTGTAVQNQHKLRRAAWIAPILLAGLAAYFLGRIFGTLLLWTLAL
jgi:hypothetical protein